MQHDNYGRGLLPAQTPVDPDQIKLFCSIMNCMMHLEKKRHISLQKGVYKGCEISGSPQGTLGHGCCQGAETHSSTDEDWKLQGNGVFGPGAVTAEGYCLPCPPPPSRAAVGSCCRKRSGLPFCLPVVHAQHHPLRTAFGSSELSEGSSLQLVKGLIFSQGLYYLSLYKPVFILMEDDRHGLKTLLVWLGKCTGWFLSSRQQSWSSLQTWLGVVLRHPYVHYFNREKWAGSS